jgi:hypothetical protein
MYTLPTEGVTEVSKSLTITHAALKRQNNVFRIVNFVFTCGETIAYTFGAPEFDPVYSWDRVALFNILCNILYIFFFLVIVLSVILPLWFILLSL